MKIYGNLQTDVAMKMTDMKRWNLIQRMAGWGAELLSLLLSQLIRIFTVAAQHQDARELSAHPKTPVGT